MFAHMRLLPLVEVPAAAPRLRRDEAEPPGGDRGSATDGSSISPVLVYDNLFRIADAGPRKGMQGNLGFRRLLSMPHLAARHVAAGQPEGHRLGRRRIPSAAVLAPGHPDRPGSDRYLCPCRGRAMTSWSASRGFDQIVISMGHTAIAARACTTAAIRPPTAPDRCALVPSPTGSAERPEQRHDEGGHHEKPQHHRQAELPVIAEAVAARPHHHQVHRRCDRREESRRRGRP